EACSATEGAGFAAFDVDYILIKAAGLPSIVVAPIAALEVAAAITNEPQAQSVLELSPAEFSVGAGGNPPPTFQWYTNSTISPGATGATFNIPSAALSLNNMMVQVVAA